MLIPGIWRTSQLTKPGNLSFLGRSRPVAVTLYAEIAATPGPGNEELLELVLRNFPTHTGTFKRTQTARFREFDEMVAEVAAQAFAGVERIRVHDTGVSDGRTAVDFYELLRAIAGDRMEFVASDAFPDVIVIRDRRPPAMTLVLDGSSEELVQIIQPPFVLNVSKPESRYFPLNQAARKVLFRTRVRWVLARYQAGDAKLEQKTLLLLNPRCRQLADSDAGFSFEKRNVLDPPAAEFEIVRAMNVLNRGYFTDAELARAVANVFDSLVDGGLFITGRNQDRDSRVLGAIYRKKDAQFETVCTRHSGSPIHRIIMAHGG